MKKIERINENDMNNFETARCLETGLGVILTSAGFMMTNGNITTKSKIGLAVRLAVGVGAVIKGITMIFNSIGKMFHICDCQTDIINDIIDTINDETDN